MQGAPLTMWLVVAIACCGAYPVEGKVHFGSLRIGGDGAHSRWQYISKFGFGLGDGEYDVRLRLNRPPSTGLAEVRMDVDLYLDEDWHRTESLSPCERTSKSLSRRTWPVTLDTSGQWSDWKGGVLQHRVRPHIWYFALSDCRWTSENSTLPVLDVDFEFRARQEDGSELGVEMRHMLPVNGVMLFILTCFVAVHVPRCRRYWRSAGELHPAIWGLSVAMALQYASQVLHGVHLYLYHADGQGIWVLDAFSENLSMVSQVLTTGMFVALAQGYTLMHWEVDEMEFTKMEVIAILVTHVMLVGLGKMEDGASHKHHENEGTAGWLLLALRLLLCCKFWSSVRASMSMAGTRLQTFLSQLRLAGSAYLIAYPVLLVVVQAFAPYLRHPVMHVGLLVAQLASSVWLAHLFLGRKNCFYEVSQLGASLLPGSPLGKRDIHRRKVFTCNYGDC